MIDYYQPRLDVTLLGCGFLGSYHIGAIYLLKQIWPQKPYNRICGASSGGVLGALLIAGVYIESVLDIAMNIIRQVRQFVSIKNSIEGNLEKLLPSDAHLRCSGKVGISITKVWPIENMLISEFESRQDLLDAVCAGSFIPIWSGSLWAPKFRGMPSMDGAYTNNTPKFSLEPHEMDPITGIRQIEISPFASHVDVAPKDAYHWTKVHFMGSLYLFNWNNLVRMVYAMVPFNTSKYKPYLIGGYSDMKEYLLKSNLIKCHQCYVNEQHRPVINLDKMESPSKHCAGSSNQPNPPPTRPFSRNVCLFCLQVLEKVDSLTLPREFVSLLDD